MVPKGEVKQFLKMQEKCVYLLCYNIIIIIIILVRYIPEDMLVVEIMFFK